MDPRLAALLQGSPLNIGPQDMGQQPPMGVQGALRTAPPMPLFSGQQVNPPISPGMLGNQLAPPQQQPPWMPGMPGPSPIAQAQQRWAQQMRQQYQAPQKQGWGAMLGSALLPALVGKLAGGSGREALIYGIGSAAQNFTTQLNQYREVEDRIAAAEASLPSLEAAYGKDMASAMYNTARAEGRVGETAVKLNSVRPVFDPATGKSYDMMYLSDGTQIRTNNQVPPKQFAPNTFLVDGIDQNGRPIKRIVTVDLNNPSGALPAGGAPAAPVGAPAAAPPGVAAPPAGAAPPAVGGVAPGETMSGGGFLQPPSDAQRAAGEEKNQKMRSWEAFKVGVTAAREGLQQSTTGPVRGRLPAVTEGDQMGDAGVGVLRPIIKDLVRNAGEGAFTEGDQAVLDQSMPDRKDFPAVRDFKLKTMSRIIAARLGIPEGEVLSLLEELSTAAVPMDAPQQSNIPVIDLRGNKIR